MSAQLSPDALPPDDFFRHPFRGVFGIIEGGDARSVRWLAAIRHDGSVMKLGEFASPLTAAIAYDLALLATGRSPVNVPGYREPQLRRQVEAALRAVRSRLGLPESDPLPLS